MSPRAVVRRCALIGTAAALIGVAGPAASQPAQPAPADRLPVCAPAPPSTRPPDSPPGLTAPGACRAAPARVLEAGLRREPGPHTQRGPHSWPGLRWESGRPSPAGYHHLGATSAGEWAGVSGRLTVRDVAIRPGTYDFVAARFMAKRHSGGGRVAWLEAGWAETGWSGYGRQRIYTFDTNGKAWRFYDEYAVRDGDRVWLELHTDADSVWHAWLWWGDRWNLLAAERLPIGTTAQVEQYVEVHVDGHRPGAVAVPPVTVDNVRIRDSATRFGRLWRDDVPSYPSAAGRGPFCVAWTTRFDTWSAGGCGPGHARR